MSAMPSSSRRTPDTFSCVVPCLNEAQNLGVLLPQLLDTLPTLAPAFEIIVVDDGSTDDTPVLLHALAERHPQLVYLRLSRNFGKEAAMTAGLEIASGQVVVCMDADLQHPPALLPQMLARWCDGIDMVYAVRQTRTDESLCKRIGTRFFYQLMRSGEGLGVPENAGDFRLMDQAVVRALRQLPERNRFMKGLFAWVGFRVEPIYYSPPGRLHGKSRFRPLKLFRFAIDGLTSFTTWPLRMLSLVGVLLSLGAFLYGLIIVILHLLHGDPVQGWTTLITVILFFSGVNLISLGVVGEYVSRIFDEVKRRPVYLISNRLGQGLAQPPSTDGQASRGSDAP